MFFNKIAAKKMMRQNTAKILIVDDEKIALKNLEHIMKKEGYEVVGTQSGPNALKLLEEQPFDVVLTDLRMEKVDGLQILKKCRELQPDTEVIMITGDWDIESAISAFKSGAYDYLMKPIDTSHLLQVLRKATEKQSLEFERGTSSLKLNSRRCSLRSKKNC